MFIKNTIGYVVGQLPFIEAYLQMFNINAPGGRGLLSM